VAAATVPGNIVVAYTKDYSTDLDVYYAYSTDGGSTWTTNNALPWTFDDEMSVDLCTSDGFGRFHAAYYKDFNRVFYTYASCGDPSAWDSGTTIDDFATASHSYPWPSVCINPTLPEAEEGCVAWTDFRNLNYGVFFDRAPIPPLSVDTHMVSSLGGTVNFYLDAGPANAFRFYLICGGVTGTDPGEMLPGGLATIPVNFDDFTYHLLFPNINTFIFTDFLGQLGVDGTASAQLNMPAVLGFEGLIMYYAFCCNNPYNYVSNPVEIMIVF
jgi:hypothetical protein